MTREESISVAPADLLNFADPFHQKEKAGQLGVFARPGGSDFNPGTGADWNKTVDLIRNGSIGSVSALFSRNMAVCSQ